MRSHINLATQPYEDAGRFYGRWLLALAVVTIISAGLVFAATTSWRGSRDANRQVRQLKQKLAQLNSDQKADEAILSEPQNQDVRLRGDILNDAIRRKAFSWTQVFSELERIMPTGLHVLSIKPELAADNQLAIRMTVAGDSRDRALELVRRMEQSRAFHETALVNENTSTQPPDTISVVISALYTPLPPQAPTTAQGAAQVQAQGSAPAGGR